MATLAEIMKGIHAVHEHSSWGTDDLSGTATLFERLGHEVVLDVPDIAIFLKQSGGGEIRLELVKENVTQHEAWAVQTQAEWTELESRLEAHPDFEFTPNEFKFPHLWAKMWTHKDGGTMQIIWRETQVYPGLFPETAE
jgi:hypothetical protein